MVQNHLPKFVHEHERGLLIEGQDDISYRLEFSPFRLV